MVRNVVINGVLNPCAMCGKPIPTGKEIYVSCQDLDQCHGEDCDCGLVVGSGCYHKLRRMAKGLNSSMSLHSIDEDNK